MPILNKRKILAISFTILSAIVVTSIFPLFNESLISVLYLEKYRNLDYAIEKLSNFQIHSFKDGNQTLGLIYSTEPGFNEMLNIIQKKTDLQSPRKDIQFIFMEDTGTGIKLGGIWSNPQFLLGIAVENKAKAIMVLYDYELTNWKGEEKTTDLQNTSFIFLLIGVMFELLADAPYKDIKKTRKRITEHLDKIKENRLIKFLKYKKNNSTNITDKTNDSTQKTDNKKD